MLIFKLSKDRFTNIYRLTHFNFVLLISTVLLGILPSLSPSHAETYLGLYGGYEFDPKPTNLTAIENMGYSSPTPDLHPATSSDLQLKQSMVGGIKLGGFFEAEPNIGFELSTMYSRPDYKQQNVSISLTDGYKVIGTSTFVEDQLPGDFQLISSQATVIYRFLQFNKIRPYMGIGPVAYIVILHADGRSGKMVSPIVIPTYNNGTLGGWFWDGLWYCWESSP